MRRTIITAVAACALALFAAGGGTAEARVLTKPGVSYGMSNACSGSECTITDTIKSNPSAYNVRAWMQCSDGKFHFGGWHTSGTSTAGCGTNGTYGLFAGFQYDETHQYQVDCWTVGAPKTGSC